jgi:hypothetical protein
MMCLVKCLNIERKKQPLAVAPIGFRRSRSPAATPERPGSDDKLLRMQANSNFVTQYTFPSAARDSIPEPFLCQSGMDQRLMTID